MRKFLKEVCLLCLLLTLVCGLVGCMTREMQLVKAIEDNYTEKVKDIIDQIMLERDVQGNTTWHLIDGFCVASRNAILKNYVDVVSVLINNGILSNSPEGCLANNRFLLFAVKRGHDELLQLLLKAGVDPNGYLDTDLLEVKLGGKEELLSVSPLAMSVIKGNSPMVRSLIEYGAKADATTLLLAVEAGDLSIVQILLESGADIDGRRSEFGISWTEEETPLDIAIRADSEQMVKFLLEAGADASPSLDVAMESGSISLIKILLEHGADSTEQLKGASETGNCDLVSLFLEYGKGLPRTAKEDALWAAHEAGQPCAMDLLLQQGVSMEAHCCPKQRGHLLAEPRESGLKARIWRESRSRSPWLPTAAVQDG